MIYEKNNSLNIICLYYSFKYWGQFMKKTIALLFVLALEGVLGDLL